MTVIWAIIILGALGLVFGVLLAIAGKVFAVEKDPKEEAVRAACSGANCGACGYPGCDGYAAAVVRGEAPVNACVPGGAEAANKIGEIMGVSAGAGEAYVAFVGCSGTCGHTKEKFNYEGLSSCLAATRLGGGSGTNVCAAGCMGFGDCAAACPFGAMSVVDGVAHVDREKCVGCMKCAEACPKKLIAKVPATSTDLVGCHSTDKGALVTKYCDYGCIGCSKCKKECPADAITIENNLAVIDQSKCVNCGHCSDICPRHCIHDIR
jgi:Na+-translocating ferredoxin:NAD+ oxidoreductase RNF subunit RnfB